MGCGFYCCVHAVVVVIKPHLCSAAFTLHHPLGPISVSAATSVHSRVVCKKLIKQLQLQSRAAMLCVTLCQSYENTAQYCTHAL